MCSETTEMHCSTGQGKLDSSLFSAALKNRVRAGLCHCYYTYGDLLFLQVCSDTTEMHCITDQGKLDSLLFSAALQKEPRSRPGSTATTPMEICSSCRCAVTQQKCTAALIRANWIPYVQCCSAKQAHSWLVSLQLHLWSFALHTGVQ